MNKNLQYLALLLLTSAATGVLHSRISNVTYKSTTADVDTDNIPTMDPTASSLDSLSGSKFISYYDQTYRKMILAENTTLSQGDKTLLSASNSDGVIKMTSLSLGGSLRGKKFDRIAGAPGRVVLRDGTESFRPNLYIVNTLTADFSEVTCEDGAESTGNIDNFVIVGDKIVTGVFSFAESTYREQVTGRLRVLSLSDGSALGMAYKTGASSPLQMHAGYASSDPNDLNNLISGTKSEVINIGSMTWDADLKRLFIAFSRNSTENSLETDIIRMPFLVCRFDGNDLRVEGLAPLDATTSAGSSIVSFYQNELLTVPGYTIPFLKTLHVKATTSNNSLLDKAYLIAQINYDTTTATQARNRRVFAIPLVNSSSDATVLGKAAKIVDSVPDFETAATSVTQLYGQDPKSAVSDVRALVGGDYVPVGVHTDIAGMEVIGQTVLVATTAAGGAAADQIGVWASTAIIDENGVITGWSPWTRVAGLYEQVFGLGVDKYSGQIWALHGNTKSGAVDHYAAVSLPTFTGGLQFTGIVTADTCGLGAMAQQVQTDIFGQIYTVKNFHANRVPGLGGNSLMAFGGNGQLVIARTGSAGTTSEMYKTAAVSNYTFQNALSTHRCVFDNSELRSVGNIYAVEFSRSRENAKGFWFVGGENGLAVISKTANDETAVGFSPSDFDDFNATNNGFTHWNIKKFSNVSGPVIALAAVDNQNNADLTRPAAYLLVLTKTGLSRIDLAQVFSNSNVGGGEITVEPIDLGLASDEYCLFLEMMSNHANSNQGNSTACGVLVTTKNMYLLNDLESSGVRGGSEVVTVIPTSLPFGDNIRHVQMLPRAPYRGLYEIDDDVFVSSLTNVDADDSVVANLLVTTGKISKPASEVYLLPLLGKQFADVTLTTGRQAGYRLANIGSPLKLADVDYLNFDSLLTTDSGSLFAANSTGLGLIFKSRQIFCGKPLNAQVKLLRGGQLQNLGSISISAMTASTGGSGGLVLTDRDGNILVQE